MQQCYSKKTKNVKQILNKYNKTYEAMSLGNNFDHYTVSDKK